MASLQPVALLGDHLEAISRLCFTADSSRPISASQDTTAIIRDVDAAAR